VSATTEINAPEIDTTYNGWSNYETWLVKLWIDNDGYAGGAESVADQAKYFLSRDTAEGEEATEALARWIEDAIDQDIDNSDEKALTEGLFADLLGRSLGKVNWDEIAAAYIQEVE
jgi:hypothetical protein